MAATWPTSLPQRFQRPNYSEAMADGRLRTPADKGLGSSRLRSTAVATPVSAQFEMTSAQWDAFKAFVASDLGGGNVPFYFPNPAGGTPWFIRLGDNMPSRTPMGAGWWMVSVQLEILP